MLDLPKWKCRQEFADFYKARIESPNDVDLLRKLKDRCDAVEAKHKMKSERTRQRNIEFWAKPGAHERTNPQAVAIDVYDLKGRYISHLSERTESRTSIGDGQSPGDRYPEGGKRLKKAGMGIHVSREHPKTGENKTLLKENHRCKSYE